MASQLKILTLQKKAVKGHYSLLQFERKMKGRESLTMGHAKYEDCEKENSKSWVGGMKPGPRIILVLEGKFPLETFTERVDLRTLLLHDLEPDNIPLNLTFARNEQNLRHKHKNRKYVRSLQKKAPPSYVYILCLK